MLNNDQLIIRQKKKPAFRTKKFTFEIAGWELRNDLTSGDDMERKSVKRFNLREDSEVHRKRYGGGQVQPR